MSYHNGFEDAVELCLSEIEDVETIEKAIEKVRYILALIKEEKFGKLKKELGILLRH